MGYSSSEYKKNRKAVLASANYICTYCGDPATTADHVIPLNMGGTDEIANLVAACHPCNSSKQDKIRMRMPYWNRRYPK